MGLARLVLGWMRQVAGPVAARLRRLAGLGRPELEESAGVGAALFDAEEARPLLDRKQKQKQSSSGANSGNDEG